MTTEIVAFAEYVARPALLLGSVLFAAGLFSAYRAPEAHRPYAPAAVLVYTGAAFMLLATGPAGLTVLATGAVFLLLAAVTQTLEAVRAPR